MQRAEIPNLRHHLYHLYDPSWTGMSKPVVVFRIRSHTTHLCIKGFTKLSKPLRGWSWLSVKQWKAVHKMHTIHSWSLQRLWLVKASFHSCSFIPVSTNPGPQWADKDLASSELVSAAWIFLFPSPRARNLKWMKPSYLCAFFRLCVSSGQTKKKCQTEVQHANISQRQSCSGGRNSLLVRTKETTFIIN